MELDQFEQQIPDILQNRYLVRPMNPQEMREAITQPLAQLRRKLSFDPKLLDTLLKHLGQEDVELTHLQIICDTLFENLPDDADQITLALYESLGAAEGILSSYLEDSLASFPAHKRATARDVLKALVSSVSTNRVLDLEAILKNIKPERDLLQDVLTRLVDKRLLRQLDDAGLPEYELAHAYLAREVMTWVDKDELENKKARELLERELAIWRLKKTPMNVEQLDVLRDHVQYLDWEQDAYPMLLHSAIYHAHDVDFWWGQVPDKEKEAVAEQIPFEKVREHLVGDLETCKRLKRGFKTASSSVPVKPLISAIWDSVDWTSKTWRSWADIQTARALWVFRSWLTLEKNRKLIIIIWPMWLVSFVGIVAIIALLYFSVPLVSAWMKKERAVRGNWVTIPAGPFVMGCDQTEAAFAEDLCLNGKAIDKDDCYSTERLLDWAGRQEETSLPKYAIMDNEVTHAQYRQCVEADGCAAPNDWEYPSDKVNYPITTITWGEANAYCAWLGGRLPTEGEWEKAARSPQGSYFPWGNNWMTDTANIERFGIGDVESVLYKANTDISDYGVKNMAGNVREWTTSPGKPNQIGAKFTNGIISSEEIDDGYPVIIKGGCWTSERSLGMASRRRRNLVDDRRAENGFRCVCPAGAECESPWTLKWKWFGNY
jgi:formylglycine-generating enzyme required for sulfatase activity